MASRVYPYSKYIFLCRQLRIIICTKKNTKFRRSIAFLLIDLVDWPIKLRGWFDGCFSLIIFLVVSWKSIVLLKLTRESTSETQLTASSQVHTKHYLNPTHAETRIFLCVHNFPRNRRVHCTKPCRSSLPDKHEPSCRSTRRPSKSQLHHHADCSKWRTVWIRLSAPYLLV